MEPVEIGTNVPQMLVALLPLMALMAGLLLLALLAFAAWTFNRLVRARNQVRAAAADIDVQLSRRYDLVPRLVEVVRGYAGHERSTFEAVTELRGAAMDQPGLGAKSPFENALGDGLGRLLALAEAYPALKANQNFASLATDLVQIEDFLQYARRYYNGSVKDLNDLIGQFPSNLLAQTFAFTPAEHYSEDRAQARNAPEIAL